MCTKMLEITAEVICLWPSLNILGERRMFEQARNIGVCGGGGFPYMEF